MEVLRYFIDFTIRTDLMGKKYVQFVYNQNDIGPFEVKNEDEVHAIITLKDDRVDRFEERENKESQESRFANWVPKLAVTRAESILSKETVKQINKAFTLRALKKKHINYPKRSQTIKVDPCTKELVLPNGDRVEQNQKDENANARNEVEKKSQNEKKMWKVKATIEDSDSGDRNYLSNKSSEEDNLTSFFEKYIPGQKRKLGPKFQKKKSKWYKE